MHKSSLVLGASGQVGEHCLAMLHSLAAPVVGTHNRHSRPGTVHLDMTDIREVDAVLDRYTPEVIYCTAATPNVDYCEQHPEETHATNVGGIRNVVDSANHHGCKLVYMSSEYIFDGTNGPYDELTPAKPLSVYGWQKVAAEHYIAAFAHDWLIIRTTVVYSWESQGKNFLYRLRDSLLQGKQISVPVDQVSSPTYAPDLVRAMIDLVDRDAHGVFNVAGPRITNRYEFALAAAEAFELPGDLIVPVVTSELKQPARRPLNAGLVVDKVEEALGRSMLDFSDALREMALHPPNSKTTRMEA